jgi:hypothetical protein
MSSERTEVELDSVEAYQCVSAYKCRGYEIYVLRRVPVPGHDLRPTLIIDGHGTSRILTPFPAQIGNFVPYLRYRIAGTSQNNQRNPQLPEISELSKCSHISFSSSRVVAPRWLAIYAWFDSAF